MFQTEMKIVRRGTNEKGRKKALMMVCDTTQHYCAPHTVHLGGTSETSSPKQATHVSGDQHTVHRLPLSRGRGGGSATEGRGLFGRECTVHWMKDNFVQFFFFKIKFRDVCYDKLKGFK